MGYKRQVAWGYSWLTFLKVITKGLTLAKIIVLARILAPRDFGLFGLVTVMLSLAEIFTETGINPFLIQTKKDPRLYYNSAWVVSIVRGGLIATVLALSSVFFARFYNESELIGYMLIASMIPLIKGFINPAQIKFQRDLQFHKDVYMRIVLVATDVVFAIVFVSVFQSALALILSQLVAALAEVTMTHVFIKPRPAFKFNISRVKEVLHFGKWLNVGGVFGFLGGNLDDLIIGKMMGTNTLGYYQNAYSVSQSGVAEVGELAAQASYPVYGRISGDMKRMRRAFYLSILAVASIMTIPLLLLLLYSKELVTIVLGEKWLPIVPILPWLGAAAYLQGINTNMHVLNLIRQKTNYSALISLIYLLLMVTLLIPFGRNYGLVGVGIALFLARVLLQPVVLTALIRVLYKKKL